MASRAARWIFAPCLATTALLSTTAASMHERADSTTIVAVTATTTITQTATNTDGAHGGCNNFYGACVVYGGYGDPSYTTTIYATSPSTTQITTLPTSLVTWTSTAATEVVVHTTTVSNSGACQGFDESSVVYSTAGGAAATTVYAGNGGSTASGRGGNSDGEIGNTSNDGGDGAIGNAADRLPLPLAASFAALLLVASVAVLA
ncbi:hypothetical protein LTR53_006780 [Teratosphaeriaceae sp. CCFEE 6253]|nr:hypothetical protein LTR53_006780 [Teratosphaeriaceae sp. CCFEE 6253]